MSRILIVDDEAALAWALGEALGDEGHQVDVTSSAEDGLRQAALHPYDAVILDVRLPGLDGLSALPRFRERAPAAAVIVVTAFGDLATAVSALGGGAFDYLVKPFDLDAASAVIRRALEARKAPARSTQILDTAAPGELLGKSAAMQALFKRIALAAPAEVPVLILGESGTGKELVARALHHHSPRREGPFVPVSLPALSPTLVESELFGHVRGAFTGADRDRPGLFELAAGGTVLLDEVGDAPPSLQVKLLRALEQREVTPVGSARSKTIDVRILAATHRPLRRLIEEGTFREDLYFRLGVFQLDVPPLRDRLDDLPTLAAHFLSRTGSTSGITDEALAALRARAWPGNVRELRNAVEHAAVAARGQAVGPEHLPPPTTPAATTSIEGSHHDSTATRERLAAWASAAISSGSSEALYERFLELAEPPVLKAVLDRLGGNRAAAAQALGIHRSTLRHKLRRYGLD